MVCVCARLCVSFQSGETWLLVFTPTRLCAHTSMPMAPLQSPDQVLAHYPNRVFGDQRWVERCGVFFSFPRQDEVKQEKKHPPASLSPPPGSWLKQYPVTWDAPHTWTFHNCASFFSIIRLSSRARIVIISNFCQHGVKVSCRNGPGGNVILWRPACIQMFHVSFTRFFFFFLVERSLRK